MSYRISILDKSPLAAGETAAQALARTLTLAQHAEAWGYHRFWVAEHHNTDQLASPSPVSYTHLRAHETRHDLVCRLLLEKKKSKLSLIHK